MSLKKAIFYFRDLFLETYFLESVLGCLIFPKREKNKRERRINFTKKSNKPTLHLSLPSLSPLFKKKSKEREKNKRGRRINFTKKSKKPTLPFFSSPKKKRKMPRQSKGRKTKNVESKTISKKKKQQTRELFCPMVEDDSDVFVLVWDESYVAPLVSPLSPLSLGTISLSGSFFF